MDQNNSGQVEINDYNLAYIQMPRLLDMNFGTTVLPPLTIGIGKGLPNTVGLCVRIRLSLQEILNRIGEGRDSWS